MRSRQPRELSLRPETKFSITLGISELIPEGTLTIGLPNRSYGFFFDGLRALKEMMGIETAKTALTRQFFKLIVADIHKVNEKLLWLHTPHSEGGAIEKVAIDRMDTDTRALVNQHLCTIAIGPASPIPRDMGYSAVNLYSKKDYITKWGGLLHKNNPNYDIRFVRSISPWSEWSAGVADHAIIGSTYYGEAHVQISTKREQHGFYGGKSN